MPNEPGPHNPGCQTRLCQTRLCAALAVTLAAVCALAVWSAGQAVAALLFGLTAAVIPALGVAASCWHRQLALRRRIRAEVTR